MRRKLSTSIAPPHLTQLFSMLFTEIGSHMKSPQKKQRGATLLVALVLLLLLTVLALTSARTATLQQRMSSNLQQQNQAFQAAENGITAAVLRLNKNAGDGPLKVGDKKQLCARAGSFAAWSNTCTLTDEYGYEVTVERVQCGNERSDICFAITSKGIHLNHVATHQQGYLLSVQCVLTEERDC